MPKNFRSMWSCVFVIAAALPPIFLPSCSAKSDRFIVGIAPLGNVTQSYVDSIKIFLETAYPIDVIVMGRTTIPERFAVHIKNSRHRADSIIHFLSLQKPDSLDKIVGITEGDISMTKKNGEGEIMEPASRYADWGVMGLAYTPGTACVISIYRIKHENGSKTFSRLKKITLHEFGHTLGLPHCADQTCFMRDAAESIANIDHAGTALCFACRKKAASL